MVQADHSKELDIPTPTMQPFEAAHIKPGHTDDVEVASKSPLGVDDDSLERSGKPEDEDEKPQPAIKGLGWLDRLLALWILLAMVVGILLGNFVDSVGPALHRGEFVGVSIPIGKCHMCLLSILALIVSSSHRTPRHDVSYTMQGQVRDTTSCLPIKRAVDTSRVQHHSELDRRPFPNGEQRSQFFD